MRAGLVLGLLMLAAEPALAAPLKIALGEARGPGSKEVLSGLEKALKTDPEIEVIRSPEGAAAVITVVVTKVGKKLDAAITVQSPSGEALKVWRVRAKKAARLGQLIEADLWNRIGPTLKSLGDSGEVTDEDPAPPPPAADSGKRKVGILKVEGSAKGKAELLVVGAFRSAPGIEIVGGDALRSQALKLGVQLDDPSGRVEIAKALGLSAYLSLKLEERGGGLEGTALVIDAADGRSASEAKASAKNSTNLSRDLRAATLPLLERTQVPSGKASPKAPPPPVASAPPPTSSGTSPPPPPPIATESAKVEPPEPDSPKGEKVRNRTPLEVTAGVKLFTRKLTYNDDLFGALRPYDLAGAPSIDARLRWYPAAHFTKGFATHIGIEGNFGYALGLKTVDADNREFGTSALSFGGGLHVRVPFAAHELGITAGYGQQAFKLSGTEGPMGIDFPSTTYGFLRAGIGARFEPFAGFHARFGFAYRSVLSSGEIVETDWFPRASVGGIDAQAGVGYEVVPGFEVSVGADLVRYFYSMNPEVGDTRIAGGAVDQYLGATLGIAFYL